LVRGNPSKRPINENEPKPAAGVPPTPKHFDKQGKYWFKRMAEELDALGVMSQLDARALELLVEVYTEYRHHCDTLREKATPTPFIATKSQTKAKSERFA
jgi:P27 family predicted phage terminase small subunit